MATKNKCKCKFCGKELDKETAYKVGKVSYYCSEDCYNQKMNSRNKQKEKYEPTEGSSRRDYTNFIQQIYLENGFDKSEINWTLLMSQTKNILSEHSNWTYTTLSYILGYMYKILELNLFTEESNGSILSLVPFYGLEAEDYYKQTVAVEEATSQFDFDSQQTKTVHQKTPTVNRRKKPIDLNSI